MVSRCCLFAGSLSTYVRVAAVVVVTIVLVDITVVVVAVV